MKLYYIFLNQTYIYNVTDKLLILYIYFFNILYYYLLKSGCFKVAFFNNVMIRF